MEKVYRLKHIPTGLYWVKRSYGRLSDTGTVFTTASNSFNGCSPDDTVNLKIIDDKFIRQHLNIFKRVGELKEHPETMWDGNVCKVIRTGKTYFTWSMTSKVEDFVKEFVTLDSEAPESTVEDKQELIKKVADICWNHRVNPDIETFDEWMNLIQNELKQ